MKVYILDYTDLTELQTNCTEQYFEFVADGERERYFAENDGEWNWAFWFTKGKGDTFSHEDLDCWFERVPQDELPPKVYRILEDAVVGIGWTFNANWLKVGETFTIGCDPYYKLTIKCVYEGSPSKCPEQYAFDKQQSLESI